MPCRSPSCLPADWDTNGHVDNVACFVAPAKVLLAWTDDQSDPQVQIANLMGLSVLCMHDTLRV